MAYEPTFAGHSVAIFARARVSCPGLANFTLAYAAGAGSALTSAVGIDLPPRHVGEAGGVREALQPEQLAGVRVEELLPEARRATGAERWR